MAIIINIDVMLAKQKMSVTELTEKVGITMANLSILKSRPALGVIRQGRGDARGGTYHSIAKMVQLTEVKAAKSPVR
jgi:hypothetical protein